MCSKVKIPSKEPSSDPDIDQAASTSSMLIPFDPLLATQSYALDQMVKGLADGIHTFFILKPRQSGITTLGIMTSLYWAFTNSGMQFSFVADNSKRLFYNRKLAKNAFYSLQKHPEWRQEEEENNRECLAFKNDSAIWWLNANSDDEGGLGRSMGVPGIWGTELGLWRDEEGVLSLMSSMSENNPRSLYVFEGTARGPNLFKELWDVAASENNTSQRAIFIGWWLHPWYEHDLKNPIHQKRFEVYWNTLPRPTRDEQRWITGIKQRFNFDIRPTQISWWRWHLREKKKDNLALMYQEYPPLEEDAWTYGGCNFVDGRKLSFAMSRAMEARKEPRHYFVFDPGDEVNFLTSDLVEVDPRTHYYDLVCYAEPLSGPRVRYALGCDPAHGANEQGDHAAIEVLLCYSDKAVQVAEFVKREIPTFQQAWVILHLVGAYNSGDAQTMINIELQGGGDQIFDEIQRMQREMAYGYTPKLMRYFQKISHYLYTRPDSSSQKAASLHWMTTGKTKVRMLHAMRNLVERDMLQLKSEELIKEIARCQQLKTGEIETPRENHRLMAMAIASMAYYQVLDKDIGGQKEFASTELKPVEDAIAGEPLSPGQIMEHAIKSWREDVLASELEEIENTPEPAGWMTETGEAWASEQEY